jgi:hypothetical protein
LIEVGRRYGLLDIAQGCSLSSRVTVSRFRVACDKHARRCTSNRHELPLAALSLTAVIITRAKLSHELPRTEIERFFNCHPFRSFMISPLVVGRQRISFDVDALELRASVGENKLRFHARSQQERPS